MTEGRRKEFVGFARFSGDTVPAPQAVETFTRSKLDWSEAGRPEHAGVLALYRELLHLRATEPCLKERCRGHFDARPLGEHGLVLERRGPTGALHLLLNVRGPLEHRLPERSEVVMWTEAPRFGGTQEEAPGRSGSVRLEGPSAVLVRLTG